MEQLIKLGVDPNTSDSFGWTPLMAAAISGEIKMVKHLLQLGADPTIEDADGSTAMMHAKKSGFKDIAKLLQEETKSKKP